MSGFLLASAVKPVLTARTPREFYGSISLISWKCSVSPLPKLPKKNINYFLAIEEALMQELEIPYRVMNICTGDLGGAGRGKI